MVASETASREPHLKHHPRLSEWEALSLASKTGWLNRAARVKGKWVVMIRSSGSGRGFFELPLCLKTDPSPHWPPQILSCPSFINQRRSTVITSEELRGDTTAWQTLSPTPAGSSFSFPKDHLFSPKSLVSFLCFPYKILFNPEF